MPKRVEYHYSDDHGDWVRLVVDEVVIHEGHDIPTFVWLELLASQFDCEIVRAPHTEDTW